MAERPRFLADEMLGSLARWLRIIGYDTAYVRDLRDGQVLELARKEGRFLLTRDHQLAERAGAQGLLLHSADLDDQLTQVTEAFDLRFDESMSRCTRCNGPLERVGAEEVGEQVPEGVRGSQIDFYRCKLCGQVYWRGSHWDRIGERLERTMTPRVDNNPR